MTFVQRARSIRQLGSIAASIAVVGACESSPIHADVDPRLCDQTYEFGNFGCTDIIGQVLGSAGQPLTRISVGPRYLPDRDDFDSPFHKTGADGRFRLRLHRFGAPPPAGEPDTVSLYIRAVDLSSADFNVPALVRDSVLIQVTVAPVGALAPVTNVVLRLPTP